MYSVSAIPAFTDNYIWALHDPAGRCVVVDPGDAKPVLAWLETHKLDLQGIVVTHHHPDHTGGIAALLRKHDAWVVGPNNPRIANISQSVVEGDVVDVLGLSFSVLEVPGHTLDHIAFYCAEQNMLFCGDTLFSCGCGRLFEGSPAQMHASLQKLSALPGATRVYCTHEYTLANMQFALAVEPQNQALINAQTQAQCARAQQLPTLPSTMAHQLEINPFLRCAQADVVTAAQTRTPLANSPAAVFATLRAWKDQF